MGYRVTRTISQIGTVVGGATPSTKNPNYWDGKVPWLSPKDLTNHKSRYIDRGARNITEAGLAHSSTRLLPKGAVLFSSRAPIGYIAIASNPVCTNQGFKSVVPDEGTDSLFLYYLLKCNQPMIEGLGSGTTFKEISASTMRNIKVQVPDTLKEQVQIAAVLGALDSKIELNNRLNGYLAQLVSTEFSERFGADTPTVELGEVLSISTKSLKPQEHSGEIWEHYSIPAYDANRRPVFESADKIKSSKYVVDTNCILISKLNPSTKRIWMPVCLSDCSVCSTEFIVYKPKETMHKTFYYAAIDSPAFTDLLLSHVTGSTGSRQRVQPKTTLTFPMPAPGAKAIDEFCAFANPIYEKIKVNEIESKQLEELRDVLLPKLMSGEIDVSKVDLTQLNSHLA